MPDQLRQGDVWLVHFDEGWERPAIIVSRHQLNRGNAVLVVPCTSSLAQERAKSPNHVFLPSGTGGLTRDSVAQAHLIQPVHHARLITQLGALETEHLAEVLLAVAWSIDLFDAVASSGA
ncbi:MAG: type II toxin-antitoxin system PemK/MazF family toxin [Planctomycetes bacterium]|nr:type II toxin-antitoxin system PemK/MazF family toxin [Planctomycetota bacterium]